MMLMILAGIWGLKKLNTQFFPSFELDIITIAVPWSGAAAEDVERSIILPIERELKSVNGIDSLFSTAVQGAASIRLELEEDSDIAYILDEVKQKVDGISSLPSDAEQPVVQQIIRYEDIARILITSPSANPPARSYVLWHASLSVSYYSAAFVKLTLSACLKRRLRFRYLLPASMSWA